MNNPSPVPVYFPKFVMPESMKLYAVQHHPWGYFITEQPEYVDMKGSRFINIKIDQFCYEWLCTYRNKTTEHHYPSYIESNPEQRFFKDFPNLVDLLPGYYVNDLFLINNILPNSVLELIIREAVDKDRILGKKIQDLRKEIDEKTQEKDKAELDYDQILLIKEKLFK